MINKKHIFLILLLGMVICSVTCVSADEIASNDTDCLGENPEISNDFEIQVTEDVFAESADDIIMSKSDDDVLSGSTVYFDAYAASDGIGSQSRPYKYLTDDRLVAGVTAHFAKGVYEVDETLRFYSGSGSQVTFIGDDMRSTVIRAVNYNDFIILSDSYLFASGLTFEGSHIVNHGIFEANNVMFQNSVDVDSYNITSSYVDYISSDLYGAAIFSGGSNPSSSFMNLTNCYFAHNKAISGGAIAIYNSVAYINNCIFYNSSAPRFGGAVHCVKSYLSVSDSIFEKSYAGYGGSIYGNLANIEITGTEFYNSQSYSFGGAIACRNTTLIMDSSNLTWSSSLADSGGAIYLHFSQSAISNSLFYCDGAFYGGAICSLKSYLDVQSSDFSDDYAVYGGDVYVSYGQTTLERSNFNNSEAYYGSSVYGALVGYLNLNYNNFVNSTTSPVVIQGSGDGIKETGNAINGVPSTVVEVYDGHIFNIYGDGAASTVAYVPESQTVLPARYDSRDYGYITPVKDQKTGGNCWSFAGIAALEACLKKATGITFDFSEENAKNLMTEYSLFGVHGETNVDGGTGLMLMSYLASWLGPINENMDIYDEYSQLASFYSPLFHIQNIYWLPVRANTSDNDIIKKAIMDYGAVVNSIDTEESAHAICLVGWDDSYRGKDLFNNTCTRGAWIFKNSWGPDWNDEGFGYLSYEQIFNSEIYGNNYAYTFIFNDTNVYDRVYQYDFAGMTGWYPESVWNIPINYKNVFTAVEDGMLAAVSTYFENSTDFVVSIFKGNDLLLNQSGHCEMGYYTIPLNSKIPIYKGEQFTVQFRLLDDFSVIPVCEASQANWPTFTRGVSFIKYDNENEWTDLYQVGAVACIKAFTTPMDLTELSISVDEFDSAAIGEEVSVNVNFNSQASGIDGSLVTILINNRPYYAMVENNRACLKIVFDNGGSYDLTAFYKNNIYSSNVVNFTFNVKDELTIKASDVLMYYGGSQKYAVSVTLHGMPVSAIVKFSVNGETYTVSTNDDGQASIDLNLPVGTHTITSSVGNVSVSSKAIVKSTILTSDATATYLNARVNATFMDSNGNVLKNTKVTFNVGNQEFTAITDEFGYASAIVNLGAGKYDVIIVNPTSGEQKQSKLGISKADSKIIFSSSQNGKVLKLTADVSSAVATGYVIFNINSQNHQVNIENGIAALEIGDLPAGEYDVTVTYSGDGNFNGDVMQESVNVKDIVIVLDADDVTEYYGEMKTFDIILTQNGVPLANANVNITIGADSSIHKTDSNGKASVVISKDVGVYDVVSRYGESSISNKITVLSTIVAENLICEYSNSSVSATFLDCHGNAAKYEDVKFIIGSQEFGATTDANGYAKAIVNLNQGAYAVTVVNRVSGEEKQIRLSITKANPAISLSSSQIGNILILTANLSSPAATGNVVFNINLQDYTVNLINGVASVEIADLPAKTYQVTATYTGDGNFNENTAKGSVTVVNDIVLDADDVTEYYGELKTFDVVLTHNGVPLANVFVTISIDGDSVPAKTDSNGKASVIISKDVGVYDVISQYGNSSTSNRITVKTTISAEDVSGEYLKTSVGATFLDYYGNPLKYRNVKFIIGEREFIATTDADGYASSIVDLTPGIYNVTVFNMASYEKKQVKLTITKANPTISFSSSQSGKVLKLTAMLSSSAATGKMKFSINLKDYYVDLVNGIATLEISDLAANTYTVIVAYDGDDNFNGNTAIESVTVKSEVTLTASDVTKYYGGSKTFDVLLTQDGVPLANADVSITIGGVTSIVKTNSNGVASALISNDVGTYDAVSRYDDKSVSNKITVKSTITAGDSSGKYLKASVSATFLDSNGNVEKYKDVIFFIEDKQFKATTDANGYATAAVDVNPGTYDVRVFNIESGESKTVKLIVTKLDSHIDLYVDVDYNHVTFTAAVSPDIATGNVRINVGSKSYSVNVNNGNATMTLSDLTDGRYTVSASYDGDINLKSSKTSTYTFDFERIYAVITADDVVKTQGGSEKLTLMLTNTKGYVIAYADVNVMLNGATRTLQTDANGRASMDIDLAAGTYVARITFDGAGRYDEVSKNVNVVVKKSELVLTSSSVSTVYGTNKVIVANLKDSNGKPVYNAKVTFNIDSTYYAYSGSAYTDSNGQAKISTSNIVPATYTVYISANNAKQIKTKLTVSKATPKITAAKKTFKLKTKTKKYTITLKNNLGKVIKSTKVKLTVKGKTYSAKTNNKGQATFKITKLNKKGKFTAVVKYAGSSCYKAVSKKVIITVK